MNVEGASQFIEHSWPLVRDVVPDAQLHIVGSVCSKLNSLLHRSDIVFHGVVEDLNGFYEDADVVVNCTTMGTGLKVKCIEAIGFGKALVTTTNGAEGIKGNPGHHYLVEDDWSEFATQVARCLVDTAFRDHLENQARVLAQSEYSVDRIYRDFDNVLSDHCGHAAPPSAPVVTKVAGEGASMVVPRSTKA
jgi:succinoglycan biosynthesis protein ExoO